MSQVLEKAGMPADRVRHALFWALLAPLCGLVDKRFRRYASGRRAILDDGGARPVVRLPDAASCTSWVVRGKPGIGPKLPEVGGRREAWWP